MARLADKPIGLIELDDQVSGPPAHDGDLRSVLRGLVFGFDESSPITKSASSRWNVTTVSHPPADSLLVDDQQLRSELSDRHDELRQRLTG